MLNQEQIDNNKKRFIGLIRQINREGANLDDLIHKLEKSDFFTAPASTQYHSAFTGGLCYHSLNVFDELLKIIETHYPQSVIRTDDSFDIDPSKCNICKDSILITSLLHDFSKMSFYETSYRNVKDENGVWTKVPFIKVREAADRFIYSTHGVNSEYMINRFMPLTLEESVAVINHMGGQEPGACNMDSGLSQIYNKYPLALFLHLADMAATFYCERTL